MTRNHSTSCVTIKTTIPSLKSSLAKCLQHRRGYCDSTDKSLKPVCHTVDRSHTTADYSLIITILYLKWLLVENIILEQIPLLGCFPCFNTQINNHLNSKSLSCLFCFDTHSDSIPVYAMSSYIKPVLKQNCFDQSPTDWPYAI